MYDAFSTDYDRFVNWPNRLAQEMPFLLQQLSGLAEEPTKPVRVLDAACGTGQHAVALAQNGLSAAGADFSAGMIAQARGNAAAGDVPVYFEQAKFGEMARTFGESSQDAILCLGNSLPHLLTLQDLERSLADFAACLRPGGLLLAQIRNFAAVMGNQERWMDPQSFREGEREWLFLRFYDFLPDGLLDFQVIDLSRQGSGDWTQKIFTTRLRPLLKTELDLALRKAGFGEPSWYGDLAGHPYDTVTSPNLVFVAKKS